MDDQPSKAARAATSVLYSGNAPYLEQLRAQHAAAGDGVPASWGDFFAGEAAARDPAAAAAVRSGPSADGSQLAVSRLIDAYRQFGCWSADLDPLKYEDRHPHPAIDPATWGLGEGDLGSSYATDMPGLRSAKLSEIIEQLRKTYCGKISAEFMHTPHASVKQWFLENFEAIRGKVSLPAAERKFLLQRLIAADALERYINTRFTGQKRFSLEGGDGLIPMLDVLLLDSVKAGAVEAVIGMAHRGRLNVLVNTLGKNPAALFEEFAGKAKVAFGSGDVKYHQGFSSKLQADGGQMHLALAFNPSHLEIVNPVVEGSVRARQDRRHDSEGRLVLPVIVHGDAAVAGQGVVMETLQMSQLAGYRTGGTIHIVINNQVGFTTSQRDDARSTYWCTDIAKMIDAPVIHVNGDDPEAGALAMRLALAYRREFAADIFVDLVCFRRHGHNEQDEPMVTQPLMYRHVRKHPGPAAAYATHLEQAGVIGPGEADGMRKEYVGRLERGESANEYSERASSSEFVDWSKFAPGDTEWDVPVPPASLKKLQEYGAVLTKLPQGFEPHARVANVLDARRAMTAGEQPVDWGMAENLAYASLLDNGYPVRLSGQDVGRGTFFHRHAALHDQKRSARSHRAHFPLQRLREGQPQFVCVDSLLSEEAVLGFEYGYSTTSPDTLVIWEAQFGDFANGAQVIIDQFISSGEVKWGRLCNLVMLLPHGYEGQGPEHSSARLERYMQLCAEYNIQIVIPSTAAQIFHVLRRQVLRPMRRPLIVMSPKSLLRNKEVASPLEELADGQFQPLLPETDASIDPAKVTKLIACSGKIYYDLRAERAKRKATDTAIVRLEQVYPFPHKQFDEQVQLYRKAKTVLWAQEEPGNQGAYHRIQHYLRRHMLEGQSFLYALRRSSASTAAGNPTMHKQQHEEIMDAAFVDGKKGSHG